MNEWARLVDKYAAELKRYDLVCAFCGQHMSDNTVNTDCIDNNAYFDGQSYFTDEEPQFAQKGRHWFGRPSVRTFGNNSQANNVQLSQSAHGSIEVRCDQFLLDHQNYT